jgi:hypothetical protein
VISDHAESVGMSPGGRAAAAPTPLNPHVCGLPAALDTMASAPLWAPSAVGVKVMLIVQLADAASVAPQSFV